MNHMNEHSNSTTAQTFRVDVGQFDRNGTRRGGFTTRVVAANRTDAAEVAVAQASQRDAERVAKFNADCERFGTTPRTCWAEFRAEKVRRFASDNR